ncbi:hypothetical protein EHP00_2410 [Ecytonucleospora hepatopenaei]|uniref:Uncharacterized protein n=1 Tax=Ecytonucleospora hepatopenaei TaxID=646526 RepID=A0A1W0E886_9MICR|nr:hypothetical protein EHP00_2410 [Ecytonucleospora hepatopenaei]
MLKNQQNIKFKEQIKDNEFKEIYNNVEKEYTRLATHLILNNIQKVNKLNENKNKNISNINISNNNISNINISNNNILNKDVIINHKGIIPYVHPDPKTNFLTISKINLWTEDDPILRFMPSVRSDKPTRIMWYEGSEIGEKTLNIKDVVNRLFIAKMNYAPAAYGYIGLPEETKQAKNMKGLFCNVCLLFNCGIHQIAPGTCIHFEEESKCICWAINDIEKKEEKSVKDILIAFKKKNTINADNTIDTDNTIIDSDIILNNDNTIIDSDIILNNDKKRNIRLQSASLKSSVINNNIDDSILNENIKIDMSLNDNTNTNSTNLYNTNNTNLYNDNLYNDNLYNTNNSYEGLKHIFCLNLKNCVIKKIINVISKFTFSCDEITNKKMPKKEFEKNYKDIVFMEHFKPCKHSGPCTKKNCTCARKEIPCELSCFCTECKNMKYCSCNSATGLCDETCTCLTHNRFCDSQLCGCNCNLYNNNNSNLYNNNNLYNSSTNLYNSNTNLYNNNNLYNNCNNCYSTFYKKTTVFRSALHGFGLFSDEDVIKENEFVMEYVGEVVSDKEAERRGNFYEANNCSYLFNQVNENGECLYSLDAFKLGNKSRYINHSIGEANLRTCVMVHRGETKIIFKAKRDIYRGEEFLFNYQYSDEQQRKHGMIEE